MEHEYTKDMKSSFKTLQILFIYYQTAVVVVDSRLPARSAIATFTMKPAHLAAR